MLIKTYDICLIFFWSYGFSYGLRPKAEVCQGRTFSYGRMRKLCLRSNTVILTKNTCCTVLCMSSFVPWWYQKYVDCVATDEEDMFFNTPDIDPTILLQVIFIRNPKIWWKKKFQSLFQLITLWGEVISGEGFRFSHTCVFTFLWIFTIL